MADDVRDLIERLRNSSPKQAIKMQADILKRIFKRQSDIIGRFGGEEFIVITSNMSNHDAQKMAQKIQNAANHNYTQLTARPTLPHTFHMISFT